MMLNSEWVQQRANLAAERLCKELDLDPKSLSLPSSTTARQRFLQAAALRGWGRLPTKSESQVLHAYWLESAQIEEADPFPASRVIQLMWNSLCYRYLD